MDRPALRAWLVRGRRPVGQVAARPSRSRFQEAESTGRQASGAGTGARPYIESPRAPREPALDARHLHPENRRGIAMTQPQNESESVHVPQPALSPYDTGVRCEAKPWIPLGERVTQATPAESFGKVDFDDERGKHRLRRLCRAKEGGRIHPPRRPPVPGREDPCRDPLRARYGAAEQKYCAGVPGSMICPLRFTVTNHFLNHSSRRWD